MVLAEGTLIGWYRECNFIPHTNDVDFAYMADEYDPAGFEAIVDKKTEFKPKHRFGKVGDIMSPVSQSIWLYVSVSLSLKTISAQD